MFIAAQDLAGVITRVEWLGRIGHQHCRETDKEADRRIHCACVAINTPKLELQP